MSRRVTIGILGCGNVCSQYFRYSRAFSVLNVVACADIDPDRARARAHEFDIRRACSVQDMITDPEIQLVVNLTPPQAHAEVSLRALESGSHVYAEKPLAINREQGQQVLTTAKEREVRVGGAPDTFLGTAAQTCRKLIDSGVIGTPLAATASMVSAGPESWHPNPEFFYKAGAGPLWDMGPYYLTALINLLGPIRRVTGSARINLPERKITSEPLAGTMIKVDVPTHVTALIEFVSGPIATLVTSFDVQTARLPNIEIYGSEGTLSLPDPNGFDGEVYMGRNNSDTWSEMRPTHTTNAGRGIGVADMATAILGNRPHRASGNMTFHVLDVMQAIDESVATGQHVVIESKCSRPAALPVGLRPGTLD